jgi:hypothetical protein
MLDDAERVLLADAIREHRFVTVRYNRGVSTLAPYGTVERKGALYLNAVTIVRDGARPARLKLGTFNVGGLSELAATPVPFSPTALYAQVERQARGRPAHARTG